MLALVIPLVATVFLGATRSDRQKPPQGVDQEAVAWDQRAAAVFGPVAKQLPDVAHHVEQWRRREVPAVQVDAELGALRAAYTEALRGLANLPPLPATAAVVPLYRSSLELGPAWVDVTRAAVAARAGPTADQLYLSGRRLRELADRVFDRGHLLLEPLIGPRATPGVEIVRPPAIPDWVVEGLAPGPPIADPSPTPTDRPLPQGAGNTQRRATWISGLFGVLEPPRPADLTAAAARGDTVQLIELADRLDAAAFKMRGVPDPLDRETGTRADPQTRVLAALRFLIDAEAARLLALGPRDIAHAVLRAGQPVWVRDLPPR